MIEQRSPEWFAQRAAVSITGSMVGSVLGISPFASRDDALREKVRAKAGAESEFKGNFATEWGTKHEPVALEAYQERSGQIVFDTGQINHPEYEWIAASPDGLIGRSGIVEIKCPFSKKIKPLSEAPHYYAQIQLQLHCTSREWCDFIVWTPTEMHIERVQRDGEWLANNVGILYAFHEEVEAIMADAERLAPFIEDREVIRDDDEFLALASQWKSAVDAEAVLKATKESLKKKILAAVDGRRTRGGDLLVYATKRPGTIKYSQAFKDLMPDADLSAYKGTESTSWTIKTNEGTK